MRPARACSGVDDSLVRHGIGGAIEKLLGAIYVC